MWKRLAVLALVLAAFCNSAAAQQDCRAYLNSQLRNMLSGMEQCRVSAELLHTAPMTNDVPRQWGCSEPVAAKPSQLDSLKQCARVYFCAGMAYRCAIAKVSAGSDCPSAMNTCIQQFPVPK